MRLLSHSRAIRFWSLEIAFTKAAKGEDVEERGDLGQKNFFLGLKKRTGRIK